jgi:glycosyltransferase involved in cell wall biosynthesis
MEHRIQWFENLPKGRLPQLYRAALVFIYPSIFEGFGIPILEALFSGCPVITSQGGVFPETAGPHSLLVDPMSEDSLRAALVRLTSDSGLRDQMRRLGNRYAFERFEPEARMADLHRSYQNILSLR